MRPDPRKRRIGGKQEKQHDRADELTGAHTHLAVLRRRARRAAVAALRKSKIAPRKQSQAAKLRQPGRACGVEFARSCRYQTSMSSTTILAGSGKAALARHTRALRIWLAALAALIGAMILVGGATRLTDSGLSITEWTPIVGVIPPLSESDWNEAFASYKTIPEYTELKRGMSLDEFKTIYWWEWTQRFLGRMIGFAFLIPFAAFWL